MALSMKNNIILNQVPVAWLFKASGTSGGAASLEIVYKFDNTASAKVNIPLASAAASSDSKNVQITRGDGAIIQFPAVDLTLDGTDETVIAASSGSGDAGKGTIELVVNEAPIGLSSFTAFIGDLVANKDTMFLVIIPTGYSYSRKGTGTSKEPDGFIFAWAKFSANIDLNYNNQHNPLTLSFAVQKNTEFIGDLTSDPFTGQGIAIKLGGSDISATLNIPPALTSEQQTLLNSGGIVVVEND